MKETGTRIESLDSLRGMAALSVVLLHIDMTYSPFDRLAGSGEAGSVIAWLFTRTPLAALFAGGSAVILFFVLSGFVLALPFVAGRAPSYGRFVVRRICRIYLPYLSVLPISALLWLAVANRAAPETTGWFSTLWMQDVTLSQMIGYILMTGFSYHMTVDFVVWSLIHEMRISLVFPVLVFLVIGGRIAPRLAVVMVISLGSASLLKVMLNRVAPGLGPMILRSWLETLSYAWLFVLGIAMAAHHRRLAAMIPVLSPLQYYGVVVIAACLYTVRYLDPALAHSPFRNLFVGAGAAVFIALALAAKPSAWINGPAIKFLGRISYSLYLFHPLVLLALVHGLGPLLPWPLIAVLVLGGSILVAWLAWRFIEQPAMQLGRRLTPSHAVQPG